MITDEQLNELQRLHEAATPGRVWEYHGDVQKIVSLAVDADGAYIGDGDLVAKSVLETDADLIAAMRNALPDLLQAARDDLNRRVALDKAREDRRLDAQRAAERERDALAAQLATVRGQCDTMIVVHDEAEEERDALVKENAELKAQLACEVAVNADYPDVVQDRDRYLAALQSEACKHTAVQGLIGDEFEYIGVSGVEFRVTRNEAGELVAEEVTE